VDPLEYVVGALDDWDKYLALLVVSAVLHWILLLRRRTLGFFDPLFFILLGSVFGWAIVWFMFLRGDIAAVYVTSFTVTELAFYAGLLMAGSPRQVRVPRTTSDEPTGFAIATFVTAATVHIVATLTIWTLVGIPLLRGSRLGAFFGSGGWGILERLSDACGPIALFSAFYLAIGNARTRRRYVYFAFVGWYAIASALSGSKSGFLAIGQCVFAVAFLFTNLGCENGSFWGGRAGKIFIGVATAFALVVIFVQQDVDLGGALVYLAYRMLAFGDVYIYAYPDATIESLRGDNPLIGLFGGFLSTFRLFPVEQTYTNLGYQLALLTVPDIDYIAGPNPRHPVFGYHFFGPLAFVFSFILGLLTQKVHRNLYFPVKRAYLQTLIAFAVYIALVNVSADFDYAMSRLASTLIGLFVALTPACLLYPNQSLLLLPRRRRMIA